MGIWPEGSAGALARIAASLERLVELKEHEMGISRISLPEGHDESSVSYFDREEALRRELEAALLAADAEAAFKK
jgi:predicted nuclease with TOPRIM domain